MMGDDALRPRPRERRHGVARASTLLAARLARRLIKTEGTDREGGCVIESGWHDPGGRAAEGHPGPRRRRRLRQD
jgi:hypothetical protein